MECYLLSQTMRLFETLILFGFIWATTLGSGQPNIILMVADDLGFNDVSWHNPDIYSPTLESLANEGIILENHYVQPICTPTRAALMTGYYPIHTGRQTSVLWPQVPVGLYTNFTLMPEYLKELGYKTHAIGKWHLGFCDEAYLPTRRGFDSFRGPYLGALEFFSHERKPTVGEGPAAYDFRNNDDVDLAARGRYTGDLIAEYADEIIRSHSEEHQDNPLFLYLPFQDVHSPLEVPQEYLDLYPDMKNKARQKFSAKVSALDAAVGNIVMSLRESGLYENSIIVFTADNGGQVIAGGNNHPLRGIKSTIWEGGTRAASFIHAPNILQRQGEVSNNLMHVTDWLPTFVSAAGGDIKELSKGQSIDGIDQWPSLLLSSESPRTEMIYNIDPGSPNSREVEESYDVDGRKFIHAGIRVNEMKLLLGNPGQPDAAITPDRVLEIDQDFQDFQLNDLLKLFATNEVLCPLIRLYNLTADPNEQKNLAQDMPEMVEMLSLRLEPYFESMIPPHVAAQVEEGNPNLNENEPGFWSTGWCTAQPETTCKTSESCVF